jgi:tetratricopeptide (TPR) repeat protein
MKRKTKILTLLFFMGLFSMSLMAQRDQSVAYLSKALNRMDEQKYLDATLICSYAIKQDSSNAEIWYVRALGFYNLGNSKAAYADLTQSLKRNSRNENAWLLRSQINRKFGNMKEALSDFNEARKLNPGAAFAFFARTGILQHGEGFLDRVGL